MDGPRGRRRSDRSFPEPPECASPGARGGAAAHAGPRAAHKPNPFAGHFRFPISDPDPVSRAANALPGRKFRSRRAPDAAQIRLPGLKQIIHQADKHQSYGAVQQFRCAPKKSIMRSAIRNAFDLLTLNSMHMHAYNKTKSSFCSSTYIKIKEK
ncbi:hypothetical protein Bsp3421_006713 [Burkholderia sp. FERM BP-3421]|uniref:hypothetical protein n=1 Tax=Burkholderia sp. FERM BP-3421 TaxID=1494466 RepID=UPI00235FE48E|nr:hypothetical protein [Burkholderia sp. FERM BP-3421]WDD96499.1 hypothetical protein Bsp3421_006713 [Burkholderia sp. FERM BP-3421]